MHLFSLEGNIGSGKTTLLNRLHEFLGERVVILYEPFDKWTSLPLDNEANTSCNLLQLFYQNPSKHSMTFQMYILLTKVEQLMQAIKDNPDKIIFCERSPTTDYDVFVKALHSDGLSTDEERAVYKQWFDMVYRDLNKTVTVHPIYLRVPPHICMERILKRNRKGEENIDMRLISRLHDRHEELLEKDSTLIKITRVSKRC
jgi:deoxyadenosine/deoxycytidine kinase